MCLCVCMCVCFAQSGRLFKYHHLNESFTSHELNESKLFYYSPLTEEIRLKTFGSPDMPVFPATLLNGGDSVYSRENLVEIFGTPYKTCLICTGTPREHLLEVLAVEIIFSQISCVCGYELNKSHSICQLHITNLWQHTCMAAQVCATAMRHDA